ncbi:MAG: NADH pyrophosphatase [bacterium]|nr:NADH pyrophosphatase [bacterium]
MSFDESKYRAGYSMGVGGVVLCGEKVLLARRALGNAGDWTIPGGYVEHNESIEAAVQREVFEETGVKAEVEGLVAVRNRVTPAENGAYFIFLLHANAEAVKVDGFEIDQAGFFSFAEIQLLERLQPLSRIVVTKVLQAQIQVLRFHPHPKYARDEYLLLT